MNFLVVTNAPTFIKNKKFSAYAPYVNEMNIWFSKVDNIGILSPGKYPQPVFTKEFEIQDLKFFKLPFFEFRSFLQKFRFIFLFPKFITQIFKAFIWADHIHLRCPGNIGLLACVVQIFFPKKPKTVKYAGNWDPNAEQPWSYKFQKWILSNTFLSRNMKVLVYGEWPGQSKNVVPFFTASFSRNEIPVPEKVFREPFLFLFVGNLVSGKQPLFAIQLVEELKKRNHPVMLEIYGEGILKAELEEYCAKNNLEEYIVFKGNKSLNELKEAYKKAHFLVLVSKSEGWPKAVAEAMFFGCIPIATPVSCVTWMLGNESPPAPKGGADNGEIKRGLIWVQFRNKNSIKSQNLNVEFEEDEKEIEINVGKVDSLIKNPEKMKMMSKASMEWSQQYTLEKFDQGIGEVMKSPQPRRGSKLKFLTKKLKPKC